VVSNSTLKLIGLPFRKFSVMLRGRCP